MSVVVRHRDGGGLDVIIRTRLKDGTRVRVCVRSPVIGKRDALLWARCRQSELKRNSAIGMASGIASAA